MRFDPLRADKILKFGQLIFLFANITGKDILIKGVFDEHADGLADTPFNRMEAVTAIGDVRSTNILVGRQEVLHSRGQERTEGNLERQRSEVDVVAAPAAGVQINVIISNADAIVKIRGAIC